MRELINSQVFLPVEDENPKVTGFQSNTKPLRVAIEADDGAYQINSDFFRTK